MKKEAMPQPRDISRMAFAYLLLISSLTGTAGQNSFEPKALTNENILVN